MPDCNKCIWSTRDGRCVSWECDFISHEDARRIDWLSELAERRKAPEIIHCGECKHRLTHNCVANVWVSVFGYTVNDDFYCGLAERRTDGKTT